MPSSLGHALAGAAIASPLARNPVPKRFWVAAILCAAAPDLDVLWHGYVTWGSWAAHRGFTHSLTFAVLLGTLTAALAFREPRFAAVRWRYAVALVLATASHGFLDGMAVYGTPVMYFWPFSTHRYLLPWHLFGYEHFPRPMSIGHRVLRVVANEVLWIGIPSALLLAVTALFRKSGGNRSGVDLSSP
ncbi:MAG TPA: metal-dependent hydrolase [Gemmatimonadales bacterium]|nr:metal-dependent hydrolase [Gemmatimonadales bacterium]